jgi:transposase-like protein
MALDRLDDYPLVWATAKALAPMIKVGPETLRKWIVQAQVDGRRRSGATSAELEENKRLRKENRDLKGANEILRAALLPAPNHVKRHTLAGKLPAKSS